MSDDSRKAFEKWALENGQVRSAVDFKRDGDDYSDREVGQLWYTWKAATEWQPIKTAPKDGARVLLFGDRRFSDDIKGGIATAWWDAKYQVWEFDNYDLSLHPTHWMPLPNPPQSDAQKCQHDPREHGCTLENLDAWSGCCKACGKRIPYMTPGIE